MRRLDLQNPARPLICVDLNGVLDAYTGWKHADHWDPPRPGAREFLQALHAEGFDVVVFTTRHPVGVRRWLREHALYDLVDAVTSRKPAAHVFVDDRAVCFRGSFADTLTQVKAFKAHWE
jgi:beta-phosphoglucomutase-like phosphatase (HAD superfamily)